MPDPIHESLRLTAETEQARLDLIRTDLGVCLTLADLAETEFGLGNREHAEQTLAKAEKGYSDMLRLFSEATGVTDEVESELRSQFKDISDRLAGLQRLR